MPSPRPNISTFGLAGVFGLTFFLTGSQPFRIASAVFLLIALLDTIATALDD